MKVLIKGAGDLATGIAYRLKKSGFEIIMTEAKVPTTVRRTVAFSRAVYEATAVVEGIEAVRVENLAEAYRAINEDKIPVIVDENADIIADYRPEVLVDAIIAKRNLGTAITDAGLVIGVGPGFTAGKDCHAVIETKRGHYLGRVIREGQAIPNTGVPGMINGYAAERIIRAAADGEFVPLKAIGDTVQRGETVALSGGAEVRAEMSGMIRGMLQEGVAVYKGMKVGDIDARCEAGHCHTVSDKARAIGGGVLEAICSHVSAGLKLRSEDKTDKNTVTKIKTIGIVLLAAGEGRRYGSNKLLEDINGKPMFSYAVDAAAKGAEDLLASKENAAVRIKKVIVTGYDAIAGYAEEKGFEAVYNLRPELGISESIRLGLSLLWNADAVVFGVCDQPGVNGETYRRLVKAYMDSDRELVYTGTKDESGVIREGNPCIFGKKYFEELMRLSGDCGGKGIIRANAQDAVMAKAESTQELEDIDFRED